jgi:small-conductance mechanosensitive channel
MAQPMTAAEFNELLARLFSTGSLIELGLLAACLGLAWVMVRAWRGPERLEGSVWFGDRLVDGVLFPALALVLAVVASRALAHFVPLTLFRIAVPALVSLLAIRLTVRVLHAAFPQSRFFRIVERSVSWAVWGCLVLWVTGLLPLVLAELDAITWSVGSTRMSLLKLIEGALSAVVVMIVALWVSAAIEARLLRDVAGSHMSLRKIAANGTRALLLFVGLMLALSAAGIDLTALSVFGGAIGVGLGFGLQKLASNYVSGFVILAERSVRIGDTVRVDTFEGKVVDINTRYTVVRGNAREALVPNELFITQRVETLSRPGATLSMSTVFVVPYGTDVAPVRERVLAAVRAVPRVSGEPALHLTNFVAGGLELTLSFSIDEPLVSPQGVRSEVNLAVLDTLNGMGIPMTPA